MLQGNRDIYVGIRYKSKHFYTKDNKNMQKYKVI